MIKRSAYFYAGNQRVALVPDSELFTVRLTRAAQIDRSRLADASRRALAQSQAVTFLAREGLHIYRHDTALQVGELLRRDRGVAHAMPVFHRTPGGADTLIVTARLLAQFRPELGEARIAAAIQQFELRILEPLSYASPHGFLLEAPPGDDGLGAIRVANALVEGGLVVFAEPDLIQSRHWKQDGPPDPNTAAYLDRQWHLKAVQAQDAWKRSRGSPVIRIAILDDGLDIGHAEFAMPVALGQPKIADQFDFATGTTDASPRTYIDNHGTACAGVAAAAGVNAPGVAPGCRLIIARVPDYLGVSDEAKMFLWAADAGADVISCSWGPADGSGATVPLPTATRLAIGYCVTQGRAGKGIPIFWAAGNGAELVSGDGYASNPDVMAIAACTAAEQPSPYSDYGPEIFACAPSNGGLGQPAIFTTDRRGPAGYNPGSAERGDVPGDYTNSFGGTSSAAPLAAGIAALALSVNPALTVQQVRDLLMRTADRIGDQTNYDSLGHSDHYGHGRLNAARVVDGAAHPAPITATGPLIIAPSVWSRVDAPPAFHVDPTPNRYYVVEVASQPELFDAAGHGSLRNADNFYGSWSDAPLQASPTFDFPAAAWARLRVADRLWYRVGSSSSATSYADYLVSTLDDQGAAAPSISILAGVGAPPTTPGSTRSTISDLSGIVPDSSESWIEGPARWDRTLGPPTFRLELHDQLQCRVEIAVEATFAKPFVSELIQPPRAIRSLRLPFQAYTVPLEVWSVLGQAERLHCRLVVSAAEVPANVFVMELAGRTRPDLLQVTVRAGEARWRAASRSKPELGSAATGAIPGTATTTGLAPATRGATATYAGLDRLEYPGDDVMRDLANNTNLWWAGFYLAPAPNQGYAGWMSKAGTLRAMGWGLAPVFVGQQWKLIDKNGKENQHDLTAKKGAEDATRAVTLADSADIGENSVIYLDIETGGLLPASFIAYAQAWFDGVRSSRYRPGAYCSYHDTANQLHDKNPDLYIWVWNTSQFKSTAVQAPDGSFRTPPIEDSGCAFATAWQYIQDARAISVPHADGSTTPLKRVDLDCAIVRDPSHPELTTADTSGHASASDSLRDPSIVGPTTAARSGPAPQFEVDPGSGVDRFYAVEVATQPELLDDAAHGADRSADSFYASWQDNALLSSNPYHLPDTAWEQLRAADALYYRAIFSTSQTDWVDLVVTTPDADLASAPAVAITVAPGERSEPTKDTRPTD